MLDDNWRPAASVYVFTGWEEPRMLKYHNKIQKEPLNAAFLVPNTENVPFDIHPSLLHDLQLLHFLEAKDLKLKPTKKSPTDKKDDFGQNNISLFYAF